MAEVWDGQCAVVNARLCYLLPVELLNLILIFVTAFLVFRRPEKERLAFRLLVVSVLLMILLFSMATRSALLPGVNY